MVDVEFVRVTGRLIPLATLKAMPELAEMPRWLNEASLIYHACY